MDDPVDPLILDLLEWVAARPRTYTEVMDAWRTSCPRLTIWLHARHTPNYTPYSPSVNLDADADATPWRALIPCGSWRAPPAPTPSRDPRWPAPSSPARRSSARPP